MTTVSYKSLFISTCLALSACTTSLQNRSAPQSRITDDPAQVRQINIDLRAGQVLTITSTQNADGPEALTARKTYFDEAFGRARQLGMTQLGYLKVTETVAGDTPSEFFSFFSWPSKIAADELQKDADWPNIKTLRPVAWNELDIFNIELSSPIDITFRSDKFYTVAVVWTKPGTASDYERYLDGIELTVKELGGRFIYKMRSPEFEHIVTPGPSPTQLTFVEWDSYEGLKKFQKSEGFKQNHPYFQRSVSRFLLHRLAFPDPK